MLTRGNIQWNDIAKDIVCDFLLAHLVYVFGILGCASLQYLQGDNLAMQLSFGDNILTSTMVNGEYIQ